MVAIVVRRGYVVRFGAAADPADVVWLTATVAGRELRRATVAELRDAAYAVADAAPELAAPEPLPVLEDDGPLLFAFGECFCLDWDLRAGTVRPSCLDDDEAPGGFASLPELMRYLDEARLDDWEFDVPEGGLSDLPLL